MTNAGSLLIAPALLLWWLAAGASQVRAAGGEACRVAPSAEISARIVETPESYRPLTGQDRWNIYFREAFWSPGAFFRAAGPALGSHLDNNPPEWGQGSGGFSRRAANRFGRFALQETYEAAGAALLQHEVRYLRSSEPGFRLRAAHALKANFVTYNKHGRQTPHIARIGSTVAAEFTGNLWMPSGHRGASETLRGVGMRLGIGSAVNLLREFSPELRRLLPRN
ncbi:MAG: hypothetical protein KIT09_15150 [Bryobacteraceae bacterium]|nr:hypothetical protein [Bryobacteraceae bacterium]